jgi:hypothetical protein
MDKEHSMKALLMYPEFPAGVLLWVINSYIPMQSTIKKILNVVVIIAVILWLLSAFGVIGNLSTIRIGK